MARLLLRLALCLFAMGAGAAAARYTDLARYDLTRGEAPGALSPAQRLRASVR